MSVEIVRDTILKRRTIKPMQYADRPVEQHIIDDILESARWAHRGQFLQTLTSPLVIVFCQSLASQAALP